MSFKSMVFCGSVYSGLLIIFYCHCRLFLDLRKERQNHELLREFLEDKIARVTKMAEDIHDELIETQERYIQQQSRIEVLDEKLSTSVEVKRISEKTEAEKTPAEMMDIIEAGK